MSPSKRTFVGMAYILSICLGFPQKTEALNLCSILCSCTASTNTLGFGSYNPINHTAISVTGTMTVSCQLLSGLISFLVPYTVNLSKGLSTVYTQRQMLGPSSNLLNYNLYADSALTMIWGDGTGNSQNVSTSITVTSAGINVNQLQTIYAQIPAGQNVKLGMYSDTITATVVY